MPRRTKWASFARRTTARYFSTKSAISHCRRKPLCCGLCNQLWRRAGGSTEKIALTTEAGWALLRHPWSLNIRELEQAIAGAVVLGKSEPLGLKQFPFALPHAARSESGFKLKQPTADLALRQQLDELLREHHGNVTAVARAPGKGPTQVQRWLKRLGLVAEGYRTR